MEAICKLRYQRYSSLKLGRIVKAVKGKSLFEAENILNSIPGPTKEVVRKAIKSAGANLSVKLGKKLDLKNVWIKKASVDNGPMKFLRRYNAGPQGRAMPYTRAMSHLYITVSDIKEN